MFEEERDEFLMSKLVQVVLDARLSPSVGTPRSGSRKLSPSQLIGVRGKTYRRRSTGRVSARGSCFPTHTSEPLLLTWVV